METTILNNFLDEYLQGEKGRRKNTLHSYKITINQLYNYFQEKYNINNEPELIKKITRLDLNNYILDLKSNYKIPTINSKIGCWKSYWRYLKIFNYVDENITKSIEMLIDIKTEEEDLYMMENDINKKEILTKDELHKALKATYIKKQGERQFELSSTRNRFILALTNTTGLRIHEVVNAKFTWLSELEGGYMLNIPSAFNKNKVNKRVPITDVVWKYYNEYLEERNKLNIKEENKQYIILSNRGKQYDGGNWNKTLAKIMKKANIDKHITSHCGRHYFTTECINNNKNKNILYGIGGWKQKGVPYQNYLHSKQQDKEKIEVCKSLI